MYIFLATRIKGFDRDHFNYALTLVGFTMAVFLDSFLRIFSGKIWMIDFSSVAFFLSLLAFVNMIQAYVYVYLQNHTGHTFLKVCVWFNLFIFLINGTIFGLDLGNYIGVDMKTSLSFISGILFMISFVPYASSIVLRKAKPSKVSWSLWASLDIVLFVGMLIKHSTNFQILGAIIGATAIAILSFIYGNKEYGWADIVCGVGVLLGLSLMIFMDANLGTILMAILMLVAGIPTIKEAWSDPDKEDKLTWVLFWISCVFALIAIPAWDVEYIAQPLSFFVFESVMMFILFIYPRTKR